MRKQFWSLLIYQKKNCLLSIVLSCILIFDQFKGHFGLFGAVSGYFGVRVGSENCFWVYLYILSNFVSWVTQNSLLFQFWQTQGHFGLYWAILGSGKDQKSVLVSLHISEKNHFLGFTLSWPILRSFWAFWDCVVLIGVGERSKISFGVSSFIKKINF